MMPIMNKVNGEEMAITSVTSFKATSNYKPL